MPHLRRRAVLLLAFAAVVPPFVLQAQEAAPSSAQKEGSNFDRVVPFVPTPLDVVQKMLEYAEVTQDDVVYDLGSGDGRIVIMAAQKFGARAVGIELDEKLFEESTAKIKELGLEKRAKIIHGNIFESYFRPATVVTLYLLTSVNERLRPLLEKQLRPGTRIVSHDFQVRGWKPEKETMVMSENGISHSLYLYRRP